MKRNRKYGGFTLAEMLIVVAIVVILTGVSFVGVQSYQSSSTRLEFDAIAKEIFIAAQNHLTAAAGQGYMNDNIYANIGTLSEDKNNSGDVVCWYAVKEDVNSESALKIMLPNYALDPTVLSGSYVIRYQPSSGTVLDVFYSRPGKSTFLTLAGTTLGDDGFSYEDLMGNYKGDGNRSNREGKGGGKAIVGWYGGGKPVERGERLIVPSFEIINAERLLVRVNDPNSERDYASMKLVVTGNTSKAEKIFPLVIDHNPQSDGKLLAGDKTLYSLVLDDITYKGTTDTLHFSDIMKNPETGKFLPGEDITVKVVAYSNTKLANIAMSEEKVTNSLFADPKSILTNGSDAENGTVAVANIRHLENLSEDVSDYKPSSINKTVNPHTAKQITDLSWPDFKDKTNGDSTVICYEGTNAEITSTTAGCFYPVNPGYALIYDGQNHKVTDMKVNIAGDAGMFGTLTTGSAVKDLELIDFDIVAASGGEGGSAVKANAGALVGTAEGAAITNVLAYNTNTGTDATIIGTGSVGGLIGSMSGGTVEKCASGVLVTSTGGDAGGLIGKSSGGTVTASYSGGHTKDAKYFDNGSPIYNVTASSGKAGGLIGDAGNTGISNSYSTCSATGGTAGGFVGTSNGEITGCYCTGLVVAPTDSAKNHGAFAGGGSITTKADKPNYYFEIINELKDTANGGYTYLKALSGSATDDNIKPFDETAKSYNDFCGKTDTWNAAKPYDDTLTSYYKGKYNLQTVKQLGASVSADDFVSVHYGDWPAPEDFVFN